MLKIIEIIQDPLNKLPLFSYGDSTNNDINQISHILHQSTVKPVLQILPLPPMLLQNQNQNIFLPRITNKSAPSPRVELIVQPLRMKTLTTAPKLTPRLKPSISPISDPRSNPWIEKSKIKKISQIIPTKQKQAATRQVQHQLRIYPRNGGTNLRTQAEHNLVANHFSNYLMPSTSIIRRVRKKL